MKVKNKLPPILERRGFWWVSYVVYVRAYERKTVKLHSEDMLIRGQAVVVHPIEWIRRMQYKAKHDGTRIEVLGWQKLTKEEYDASRKLEAW